ncbi:MAG: Rrf2 family transcriptional regulator [Termitinemataceae bacterium]|nr:MAG: Rrf2 family transcriptional regulator [Termitinemataceae bacterium]
MRISTKGRYSLEAILLLAIHHDSKDKMGTPYLSTREIAKQTGISEGYLEQLFILLRKSGLIAGVRGAQGGYFLERKPHEITVGEILRTVEASLKPTPCVETAYCPNEDKCSSHGTWSTLYLTINEYIDGLSISDLLNDYKKNPRADYSI